MSQLDPRLHAFREDLAAVSLKDRVRAQRYSQGEVRQVAAPAAPVRVAPKFDAELATEALSGEFITVYDARDGWAWVQLHEDGYVGYTPLDGLSSMVEENTHRVSARITYLYPAPDTKRPPITKLSFSSTVAPIGKLDGRFVELSRGGFIFADHLVGIRDRAKDFVRVAERLVGVPYLWGGKTTFGIDCSALLQISLQAAGVPCPRDTDMQLAGIGEPVNPLNLDVIQRGDLLFWKGHVAIAQSSDWMIHASGHHMEVVVEQIRRAVERIGETHGPLLSIIRPHLEPKSVTERKAAVATHPAPSPGPPANPASSQQTPPQPSSAVKHAQAALSAPNTGETTETNVKMPEKQEAKPASPAGAKTVGVAPSSTAKDVRDAQPEHQNEPAKTDRAMEKTATIVPDGKPKQAAKPAGPPRP